MDWWLYNITMYGDFRDGLLLLEPQHHISMYIMYKSHEIVLLVNDVFLKTCAYIFCCLEVSNYWFQVVNTYVYPGVDCHSRIGIIIKPLNEFTEGGACPFAVLEMQKKHEKTCSTHWIPQAFFGALAYTHTDVRWGDCPKPGISRVWMQHVWGLNHVTPRFLVG